jgi:AAA+ ATPase superfamily predicted ATPase
MVFGGRALDLAVLEREWQGVAAGGEAGRAVIMTGRRRVGKSRLAEEFALRIPGPSLYFQATKGRSPAAERADLVAAAGATGWPGAGDIADLPVGDWNQALRLLAMALPSQTPSLVVLDEVPWLMALSPDFEGALQTVWDRHLSAKPVLLLLLGSDTAVMSSLQSHDHAFFGRAAVMTVRPLTVADVADMTGLGAAEAIDAWITTGGFPEIVASWPRGATWREFIAESVANPLSPLLAAGQLTVLGEFPSPSLARSVLAAVGDGARTFSHIAQRAGGGGPLASGSLTPVLKTLEEKRVIGGDTPLSTKSGARDRRYHVADPYLRFWLAFGQEAITFAERGRADLALSRVEAKWPAWRGRGVEPLVRASLERVLPDAFWPSVSAVGAWWNRRNNPEIDLVGADKRPVAGSIGFVGSIKWREDRPFDARDFMALARAAVAVPGAAEDTPLVAVSRTGVEAGVPLAQSWTPEQLVDAWRP